MVSKVFKLRILILTPPVHVRKLQGILLTYNFYEQGLGYVQGMSDLSAPLYVISEAKESTTFWLFVSVMNRTKENFAADQKGMSRKLMTLQDLIKVMDPELYDHFKGSDNLNMFFCFRWILVIFKREFLFSDIITLWEVSGVFGGEVVLNAAGPLYSPSSAAV